jgi:putative salt-induced outer membrane protein
MILLLTFQIAHADIVPAQFTGEGEFGYHDATGNSNSSSLNGKLALNYLVGEWEHNLKLTGVSTQNADTLTGERYLLDTQMARTFSTVFYGFGSFRYDKDLFSGYEYQTNLIAGIGRRFWQQSDHIFNVEFGLGYQADRLQGKQEHTQPILQSSLKLRYPLNQQLSLAQDLVIHYGEQNVHTESISGLKVMMTEKLALKFSYTLKNNTQVLAGRDNLDKLTSLNLVYAF